MMTADEITSAYGGAEPDAAHATFDAGGATIDHVRVVLGKEAAEECERWIYSNIK